MNKPDAPWALGGPRYAFIDGDLLAYPAAAKLEQENDIGTVHTYLDNHVLAVADMFNLDDFTIYLSTAANFRRDVYPDYKRNREATQRPKWLAPCKAFLYEHWAAKAVKPLEADDLLGIAITENPEALLISYDKDLKQIPGWHGDQRDGRISFVDDTSAWRNFLVQLVAGDATDNCPGIYKIGPKKAEAWYNDNGWTLHSAAKLYIEKGYKYDYFRQMYKCLFILRKPTLEWEELDEVASLFQAGT